MNQSPLSSPRPGSTPTVTPEGIICGTDGKYRWVCQMARTLDPIRRSRRCLLFTMDEHSVSSHQAKGRVSKDEIIHAFCVWVGGQSQPALRFHPPRQMELAAVRRILVRPRRNRMVLQCGLNRFPLQTDPAQCEVILDYLSRHCPRATIIRYD